MLFLKDPFIMRDLTKGKKKINTQTPYVFTYINKYTVGLQ